MGVIKDGTVSGILPDNVGFAVHYPGYPSSTSRAIETLGGSEGILKARSSQSERLKLHFRPEDPYSHPAFGDPFSCSNFLLKISKKKTTEAQDAVVSRIMSNGYLVETEQSESISCQPETEKNGHESAVLDTGYRDSQQRTEEAVTPTHLCADIVGRVSEAYHFNGMVDYQHVVAVHAHAGRDKKRKREREEVEPDLEKGDLMDIDQEDVMILVPPLFSPKDVPEKLVLKPSALMSMKKKQEAVVEQRWEMQIEPSLAIDFDIEEIPRRINWEDNIPRGSEHWEWQMAVAKLFEERPIWPPHSLSLRLLDRGVTPGAHLLRRLLFRTAYYFSTGPYRRFWIKKGYDARKDPESRIYQRVEFRVPPPIRFIGDVNATDKLKRTWKELCALRVFPCKSQISLQLFELADDYIQQEIRKPPEETCSPITGWFSSSVHERLKLRVAVRFLSVYPKVGAEGFLRSASIRFEKSKTAHLFKKDLRPKEAEHPKESSNDTSKVSPLKVKNTDEDGKYESDEDEDNNDDIDEEEEEDEEEELDDYYPVDADDGDFTLHSSSYPIGENISTNFLQELFGSFPSSEAGRKKDQDVEGSDGEYQIFGDNFSDDDDY